MSQLSIAERHQGNVVILDVDGRLILGEASLTLRDAIAAIVDKGSKKILANLKGVGYIDSSGLGELVTAFAMAQRHGAVLKLVNVTSRVQGLLQTTKLVTIFEMFDDERDAVRSFATVRAASKTA